jgi:UDP-N-acetylmuramate dehydrogenase
MVEKYDYSLLSHNTFGIDAKCRRFVEYTTVKEAQEIAKQLQEPYLLIGAGSNLLLTKDFDGTVVHSAVKGIERQSDSCIRCGSGDVSDEVVAWCVGHRL